MPSTSKKQHNFMEMIAHDPKMAKKVGVPQSVGKDFIAADKGKKFAAGGTGRTDLQKANKPKTDHGKESLFKKGGVMKEESKVEAREEMKLDTAQDKKMIKKAFAMHDKQEHKGGKGTNLAKLKKGGSVKGCGIASKGLTKGKIV